MNENIVGIGTDIIEISRIRKAFQEHGSRFLERLFTPSEQEYCERYADPFPHYAGRFAGKEAIVKGIGTGIQKETSWREVEIINDKNGKPIVYLSPRLTQMFPSYKILLSISHCHEYATATAIVWSNP